MQIMKVEVFGANIDIRYDDGSREIIENGVYELKDSDGDRVARHPATAEEVQRLSDQAADWEALVKPLDAVVIEVQVLGDDIDIYYDDGRKESIELGIYEIKDANEDTIFERNATDDDVARLLSLDPGEFGTGEPANSGPNVIEGTNNADELEGTGLDDEILGLDGNDELRGRAGDDLVLGNKGDDKVRGDIGDDFVRGGIGDDLVLGNAGKDTVKGGAGSDRVRGGGGRDDVSGGDGDDRVDGQNGNDVLNGDAGMDIYNGGLGSDRFVFEIDGVRDVIKDYEDGIDKIDIAAFGVANAAALDMTQISADRVLINLGGGDEIEVHNATVAQLGDEDFIFTL